MGSCCQCQERVDLKGALDRLPQGLLGQYVTLEESPETDIVTVKEKPCSQRTSASYSRSTGQTHISPPFAYPLNVQGSVSKGRILLSDGSVYVG